MPHLLFQDPAAQSAVKVINLECLSARCILSCLVAWMLPLQTVTAASLFQIAVSVGARNELPDSQVVIRFIRESAECNKAHIVADKV